MSEATTDAAAALGRVVSGVYVVTAGRNDAATGMLASWVQQCSFEPLQLSVAVQNGRPVLDLLADGEPFVVHVIPEGDKTLMKHFGKGFAPGEPAFEGLEVDRSATGVVRLSAALAYVECKASGRFEAGDHTLVIGEAVVGGVLDDAAPMSHVRKTATHY